MKRTLTLHYTLHQMAYWAVAAAAVSFASAYLLAKGFPAAQVGILLACGNLLSRSVQPFLADRADRIGGNVLKVFVVGLTTLSMVCFGLIGCLALPRWLFGLLYLLGIFAFDAMMPLLNAISVAYSQSGYRINYGIGRGLGAFAFSLAALAVGKVMAGWGADYMIWIALVMLLANALVTLGYPSLKGGGIHHLRQEECCSVPEFFRRYKWYCVSLLGVLFLAMFHAMTENYLIEIVSPLGGDSNTVGIALFIATVAELLVLLGFERLRRRLHDQLLLKLSGVFFTLKAVLLFVAPSVEAIYLIQLLQAVTYCFLSPTQLYYAQGKVDSADMVKGQASITAAYTLGCALGNFTGGQLLEFFGVNTLLLAGIGMAAVGAAVLLLTVNRKDRP